MGNLRYWILDEEKEQIKKLYLSGNSAQEIKDLLKLNQNVRSIQRNIKAMGIIRNHKDSFNLAIKKGRVTYQKKPVKELIKRKRLNTKLRYQILQKFNNRCSACGNTALDARLQIDHIDENPVNNSIENLQVLCKPCNKGKAAVNNKFFTPNPHK